MSFFGGGKGRKEGWEDYEWNKNEAAENSPILGYLYWRCVLLLSSVQFTLIYSLRRARV